MNDQDRIWYLASKKLTNEATAEELTELENMLRSNPEMHYALQNITDLWNLPMSAGAESEEAFERHLAHMKSTGVEWENNNEAEPAEEAYVEPQATTRSKKRYVLTGAFMIILIAAGIFVFYRSPKTAVSNTQAASDISEVSTNNGSRTKIALPDGTQVWLNAESKITWTNPFTDSIREVHLTGEAYFDVAHHKKRPFIVHTSGIDIKVLGTAFTVKSYPSDNTIEATLLRGAIEVLKRNDPGGSRVILRPSQKLVFNKLKQASAVQQEGANVKPAIAKLPESAILVTTVPRNKPDSLLKEISWVYNKLIFDGDRFDELAVKIERWYNVHIIFKNERVKQYRFKGVFEDESVQQALDALKLTAKFEYRINGSEIEIDNK